MEVGGDLSDARTHRALHDARAHVCRLSPFWGNAKKASLQVTILRIIIMARSCTHALHKKLCKIVHEKFAEVIHNFIVCMYTGLAVLVYFFSIQVSVSFFRFCFNDFY